MSNWNIKNIPSQDGKLAIVTGANSGIGLETALAFAKKKMTVILACRNFEKGQEARNAILKSFTDAQIEVMPIDTSSLKSVEHFSGEFLKKFDRLDLLVNNAGIMMSPHKVTEDGLENQFATNYTGHFALTGHLMPLGDKGFLKLALLTFGLSFISTIGPTPGSFDGYIYTKLPVQYHLLGIPETLIYVSIFSGIPWLWYKYEKIYFNVIAILLVALILLMSFAGYMQAKGLMN